MEISGNANSKFEENVIICSWLVHTVTFFLFNVKVLRI